MAGHGCRAQLWSVLGAIALLYVCGGVFWMSSAASTNLTATDKHNAASTLAAQG